MRDFEQHYLKAVHAAKSAVVTGTHYSEIWTR